MAKVRLIIHILFYFALSVFSIDGINFNVFVGNISVGTQNTYYLNNTGDYIIEVNNISDSIVNVPPRISVSCDNCEENHPLLLVVRQNKGIMSWEVPLVIKSERYYSVYKTTERTLCPFDIIHDVKNVSDDIFNPVTLFLSTSSDTNLTVTLEVDLIKNFVLHLQSNRTLQVTPSTPSFFLFEFPQDVSSVLVKIKSEDEICLIVSIQNVSCPVFDLEENVEYKSRFQTVTQQGGLIVTKEAFPHGFYIVLIVSGEDNYCFNSPFESINKLERTKNVELTVSKTISFDEYKLAVGLTFLFIFIFCSFMITINYLSFKRQKPVPNFDEDLFYQEFAPSMSSPLPYNIVYPNASAAVTPVTPVTPNTDSLSIHTNSSLDETDFDLLNDAEEDKNIFRMKGLLYLSDLARKNQSILKKKSELYFWNLFTVAIFYFLPVIQLVINDQFQLLQTGREDLCYYNFLCAHPFWIFSDFNHVFSNIGYIAFGILFICLTVFKERDYKNRVCSNKILYKFCGIPQHFGLFYAMGTALIIEGILSSCYHICPNHRNFQFDSSFMYVISTLCMIKIYQTRHPDISASANSTFLLLAGVIFIGMCGVFSNTMGFRISFTVLHLSTCLYLSLKIYYIGKLRLEFFTPLRFFKELYACRTCNLRSLTPMFPSRFVLLLLANACNWGLAIANFVYNLTNFMSYLLAIFMINLMLYTTFYIFMKYFCKEKIYFYTIIYILLSIITWTSALYFFFHKTMSWQLTPASSKLFNRECALLNFYDNHDIWHFISASAMFFSFMMLLTLDDDLTYVPRSKIVVF